MNGAQDCVWCSAGGSGGAARVVLKLFKRSQTSAPYYPQRTGPASPGSYIFTLRSTPRHHDGLKQPIVNGGGNVYFSEPLAYLRGQGVSLFRVEASRLDFFDDLYRWWAETENREAFPFDIALYFNNIDFVASLKDYTPAEIKQMIEQGAPKTPSDPTVFQRTPYTVPAVARRDEG
jgi:hypothetical protein